MRTDRLPMIARLGTMFERTADVRDQRDLEDVLEDVCRTIAELLGYRAVVVNVYRPAFDDMLTSAAVGSEESVSQLVGKSSPRETWVPLLDERFQRRGAYFVPGGEFDWDGLGVESYVPSIAASAEPDAWTAEDALFVPLRDPRGLLIGVISVDEPDTGRRTRSSTPSWRSRGTRRSRCGSHRTPRTTPSTSACSRASWRSRRASRRRRSRTTSFRPSATEFAMRSASTRS